MDLHGACSIAYEFSPSPCPSTDLEHGCEDVELSETEMCTCDSDFCNGAGKPIKNLLSIVFATILPLFIYFFRWWPLSLWQTVTTHSSFLEFISWLSHLYFTAQMQQCINTRALVRLLKIAESSSQIILFLLFGFLFSCSSSPSSSSSTSSSF